MRYLIRGLGLLLALILAETSGGTILVERQAATPSSSTVGAACPCAAGPGSYGDAKTLFCYANMCLVGSCLNSTLVPSSDGKSCVSFQALGAPCVASAACQPAGGKYSNSTVGCVAGKWLGQQISTCQITNCNAGNTVQPSEDGMGCADLQSIGSTCSSKVACIPSLNGNTVGCVNSICQITACATTGQNPINGGADCGVVAPVGGQCTSDGNCQSNADYLTLIHARSVKCANAACAIQDCISGYVKNNGGQCVALSLVGESCSVLNDCNTGASYLISINATSIDCQNGKCAATSDLSGSVSPGASAGGLNTIGSKCGSTNDCVLDASFQTSLHIGGLSCLSGKCLVNSCAAGYVTVDGQTACSNSVTNLSLGDSCGSDSQCKTETAYVSSLNATVVKCTSKCVIGVCMTGYNVANGGLSCDPQKQLGGPCKSYTDCYVSSDGNILSALNATSADCAAVVTQGVQGPYTCRITACKIGQSPNKDGTSCVAPTYAAVASYDQDNCNGRITSISPGTGDCSQSPSFSCTTSESTLQSCVPYYDTFASNTMQNAPYFSDNTSPTTYRLLNYCWKTSSGSEIYIYHPASSDGRSGSYAAHYKFDDNACITNPTSAGFSYSFTPSFRRRELSTPTSHNLGAIVKLGASCSADTACDWSQFFTGEAKSVGCASGSCRIKACSVGYQPNADGTTCDFVTVTSISKPPLPASTTSSQAGVASSATTSLSNIPSSSSSSSYFVTTDVATSVSSSPRVTTSTSVVSQDSAGFVSAPNIGDQVNASDPPSATPLVLADVSSHFTSVASQGPPKSEPPLSFSGSVQPLVVGATSLIGSTESFNQETFTSSITRGTALLNGGDRLVNGGNLTTGSGNQTLVYLDLDSQGFTFGNFLSSFSLISTNNDANRAQIAIKLDTSVASVWYDLYFPSVAQFALGVFSGNNYLGAAVFNATISAPSRRRQTIQGQSVVLSMASVALFTQENNLLSQLVSAKGGNIDSKPGSGSSVGGATNLNAGAPTGGLANGTSGNVNGTSSSGFSSTGASGNAQIPKAPASGSGSSGSSGSGGSVGLSGGGSSVSPGSSGSVGLSGSSGSGGLSGSGLSGSPGSSGSVGISGSGSGGSGNVSAGAPVDGSASSNSAANGSNLGFGKISNNGLGSTGGGGNSVNTTSSSTNSRVSNAGKSSQWPFNEPTATAGGKTGLDATGTAVATGAGSFPGGANVNSTGGGSDAPGGGESGGSMTDSSENGTATSTDSIPDPSNIASPISSIQPTAGSGKAINPATIPTVSNLSPGSIAAAIIVSLLTLFLILTVAYIWWVRVGGGLGFHRVESYILAFTCGGRFPAKRFSKSSYRGSNSYYYGYGSGYESTAAGSTAVGSGSVGAATRAGKGTSYAPTSIRGSSNLRNHTTVHLAATDLESRYAATVMPSNASFLAAVSAPSVPLIPEHGYSCAESSDSFARSSSSLDDIHISSCADNCASGRGSEEGEAPCPGSGLDACDAGSGRGPSHEHGDGSETAPFL